MPGDQTTGGAAHEGHRQHEPGRPMRLVVDDERETWSLRPGAGCWAADHGRLSPAEHRRLRGISAKPRAGRPGEDEVERMPGQAPEELDDPLHDLADPDEDLPTQVAGVHGRLVVVHQASPRSRRTSRSLATSTSRRIASPNFELERVAASPWGG